MIGGLSNDRFTAWVVFTGGDHRRFWRIFTRRGWRHCFVVLPVYHPEPGIGASEFSQVINQTTNRIDAKVFFQSPKSCAESFLKDGAKCVVKIRVDRRKLPNYVPRGFLTCVSLIKAILGVGAWYVWTPEHLARWLLRNGGELIWRE